MAFVSGMLLHFCVMAQQHSDTLPGVRVRTKAVTDINTATVNVQQLNKATITGLNSVSVADAVKFFSGVVVKDYGGIGGLKTISVRSLGANHTAVLYDGISVGDAQGGQVDLGRFSLENIESIQLSANQSTDILMPARSYASASVLSLSTAAFNSNERSLQVKFKTGSFGYINPSVAYRGKISRHISHSLFGEYQYAGGEYSYKDYETGTGSSKRTNSDIKAYHAEYDAAYYVNDSNSIRFKTYYYQSKRGLPGGVILYNSFSAQRLNNESFFAQLSWKKALSARSSLLVSSKYAVDYKYYIDPSYQNSAGKLENEFHQKELYVAAAVSYKLLTDLTAFVAADYFHNSLIRTDQFAAGFANPSRNNFLEDISFLYKKKKWELTGNALVTNITEQTKTGTVAKGFNKITPALAMSVQPFTGILLRLRASYKQIFRAPTFDDLYYTNIGNTALDPELVKQYNAGFTVNLQPGKIIESFIFTADAYYNDVKDKILAVPRQNLFQWTILNIGRADIKGIDVAALLKFENINGIEIESRFSYGFQKALDVSDPSSSIYKTQLAYTPQHSGSINVNVKYKAISFGYNVLLSSYRYRLGEQISENLVQGWATQDASFTYNIKFKKYGSWQLMAEFNNIFNQQYEIIKYYPMPGFNYRLGIAAKF